MIIILKQCLLFNEDVKTPAMVPALKEWLVLLEAHSYTQYKTSQKIFFFFWATPIFRPWKILQTDFMTAPTKLLLVYFVKFSIWEIFSQTLGLSQALLFSLKDSTTSTKRNGENYTISLTECPPFSSISSYALYHCSATLKQEVKAQVDSPFASTTEFLRPLKTCRVHIPKGSSELSSLWNFSLSCPTGNALALHVIRLSR